MDLPSEGSKNCGAPTRTGWQTSPYLSGRCVTRRVFEVLLRGRPRIMAMALAIVRDAHAADDIFQQVVLSALERRVQFRDPHHVLAWAIRAARFRAIDLARQRKLHSLSDTVLDQLESRWVELPEAELSDRTRVLHQCLDKLSTPIRGLLRLRYDEGLSCTAIADRLGRTLDAVYQALSRTHRALRNCVEQGVRQLNESVRGEVPS